MPYGNNARTHTDEQVAQIAASIKEFGWTNPILVDGENGIIAGHGRVLAARKLNMRTVPVIELAYLTDAQRQAYIIADNKLALNAGWDDELLVMEFDDLKKVQFDLEITGFDESEIEKMIGLKPELKEKTDSLKPINKTRILISVNTDELEKITEMINGIVATGCAEVDYGGN